MDTPDQAPPPSGHRAEQPTFAILAAALDALDSAVVILTADARVEHANAAARSLAAPLTSPMEGEPMAAFLGLTPGPASEALETASQRALGGERMEVDLVRDGGPALKARIRALNAAAAPRVLVELERASPSSTQTGSPPGGCCEAYDDLVACLPEAVIHVAPDGTLTSATESVVDQWGVPVASVLGREVSDLPLPQAFVERWEESLATVLSSKEPHRTECRVGPPEEPVSLDLHFFPRCDDRGAIASILCISRNTSSSRRAEDSYRTLFTEMSEGFALHELIRDADGVVIDYLFLDINPAFERLTGLGADVVGRSAREVIPGIEAEWFERYARITDSGEAESFESYSAPLDRHYSVRAFRTAPNRFATVFTDVTAYRAALDSLTKSEETVRSLVRSAPIGIGVVVDRVIVEVNPHACQILGYTPDDLLGEETRAFFASDEEHARFGVEGYRTSLQGGTDTVETKLRHRDGRLIDALCTVTNIEGRGPSAVVFTIQDITDRKAAERLLREREARFRSFFELGLIGMAASALDRSWLEINETLAEMLGYRREELSKLDWAQITPARDLDRELTEIAHVLAGETDRYTLEKGLIHKDGHIVPVSISVGAVKDGDEVLYFIALIEDLTERKAADRARRESEAQLRHSQKMEAVGRLAAGVAHDFNNQLQVVQGYCDLLLTEPRPPASIVEPIEEIQRAASHAQATTDHLLAFSRRQVLEPEAIDLRELLEQIHRPISRLIGEDIELRIEVAPNLPPVFLDKSGLHQVIVNLVVNARDAMPRGGQLLLRAAAATETECEEGGFPPECAGHHALLEITDTGTGMSAETLERLFEPFFTTKEEGKGTGLGLAMVQGFVRQSQGHIRVESEEGEGTEIRLLFPPAAERRVESTARSATRTSPAARGSLRILVVEDEPSVRTLMALILERAGYEVLQAGSPAEALRLAPQLEPHLVVTDVVMPQMRGDALVRRLREEGSPSLPVVFVSGYSAEEIPGERVVRKPFRPEVLLAAIGEALSLEGG